VTAASARSASNARKAAATCRGNRDRNTMGDSFRSDFRTRAA
jgi:hypothetical protein